MQSLFNKFNLLLQEVQQESRREQESDDEDSYDESDEDESPKNCKVDVTQKQQPIKSVNEDCSECEEEEHEEDDEYEDDEEQEQDESEKEEPSLDQCQWYWDMVKNRNDAIELQKLCNLALNNQIMNILKDKELFQLYQAKQYQQLLDKIDSDSQLLILRSTDIYEPQILMKYISLLIEISPQTVIETLKQPKYPTSCLEIIKDYNIYEANAILYLREGNLQQYIKQYINLIEELLKFYIKEKLKLPVVIKSKKRPYIEIHNQLELQKTINRLIIQVQNELKSYDNIDVILFQFLTKLIEWENRIRYIISHNKQKQLEPLRELFGSYIPQILLEIINTTDMDLVIWELQDTLFKLNSYHKVYGFSKVLYDLKAQSNILKQLIQDQKNFNRMIVEIIDYRKPQGRYCQNICHICNEQNINTKMIIFVCGHALHQECAMKNLRCRKCPQNNIEIFKYQSQEFLITKQTSESKKPTKMELLQRFDIIKQQ
ncbi:hypothetical protein pb186bvf_005424 [Paramecium bursaria]